MKSTFPSSVKTNPRNEGRTFLAWCGGEYKFIKNDKGKLCITLPHHGVWDIMDRVIAQAHEEISWRNQYGHGWQSWQDGEDRRGAKRLAFLSRYRGSTDHSWRQLYKGNWVPPEEGEGRMTVSKPPFEW